ncbi:hypothetical protein ACFQ71_42290 [Streptomyces sp. NPDC056534]|uniref:hypothetical protein n=1 Tax=Streptomyces sp. NPDC056534 TaxID=3345857 RepID=UPI003676D167
MSGYAIKKQYFVWIAAAFSILLSGVVAYPAGFSGAEKSGSVVAGDELDPPKSTTGSIIIRNIG